MNDVTSDASFGLALTLCAWMLARLLTRIWRKGTSFLNPVLIGSAGIIAVLLITRVDYDDYMQGGSIISGLLGPAVVALAIPIYRNRRLVSSMLPGLTLASTGGVIAGMAVSLGAGLLFQLEPETLLALSAEQSTSAVAYEVVTTQGGSGSLAVIFSIASGIIGAIAARPLLRLLRIRDDRTVGFALGAMTHAIGTSRALELGAVPAALAGVGMALSAIIVSVLVPLAAALLTWGTLLSP